MLILHKRLLHFILKKVAINYFGFCFYEIICVEKTEEILALRDKVRDSAENPPKNPPPQGGGFTFFSSTI